MGNTPFEFRCTKCRNNPFGAKDTGRLRSCDPTGRRKRRKKASGHWRRSSIHSYEYVCSSCGHQGWSSHHTMAEKAKARHLMPGATQYVLNLDQRPIFDPRNTLRVSRRLQHPSFSDSMARNAPVWRWAKAAAEKGLLLWLVYDATDRWRQGFKSDRDAMRELVALRALWDNTENHHNVEGWPLQMVLDFRIDEEAATFFKQHEALWDRLKNAPVVLPERPR
jgi:hypothetical protein